MASIPYLIISPTALLSFIGLLHGKDTTVPTPAQDWNKAIVDVIIPAHNEEKNIVLCLASIANQTVKPRKITLYDDGSTDETLRYAKEFGNTLGLNFEVVHREKSEGKTISLKTSARNSDCDVLVVLDGDTTFRSENYIERLVFELYQGVGIACACGVILPMMLRDRKRLLETKEVKSYVEKNPSIKEAKEGWGKNLVNFYREELYLFLQRFIYHAEMVFFGSIINPVGCAVAYRREYIKNVVNYYEELLGNDLTTSEDIFIGFAFADYGYRNIQVQDVYALTEEPPITRLPKQIFMWSSAFLQSCYYFTDLLMTPFKFPRKLFKSVQERRSPEFKEIKNKRKVLEAYRQSFGVEYTKKYGRPIGWYVFTSLLEKISFPVIILIMIVLQLWEPILITFGAEVLLYSFVIAIAHRNRKIRNFFKSILLSPIRYSVLLFDLFVLLFFIKDLLFAKNRKWMK